MLIDSVRYLKRRLDKRPFFWNARGLENSTHLVTKFPKVSILIPTRDSLDLIRNCVTSVIGITSYPNYEILILDNDSVEPETKEYFSTIADSRVRIVLTPGPFNYSKIMNSGVNFSTGELICALNNDTVILESTWLADMVSHLAATEVGVVGALLKYPNGAIQHAGIALGYSGTAGHVFAGQFPNKAQEQNGITTRCYPVSAATFACALTAKSSWVRVGGLDESLKVGLNDVDYCLRLKKIGLGTVICTKSPVIHLESQSRKSMKSIAGFTRAAVDVIRFNQKHGRDLNSDAYFERSNNH